MKLMSASGTVLTFYRQERIDLMGAQRQRKD